MKVPRGLSIAIIAVVGLGVGLWGALALGLFPADKPQVSFSAYAQAPQAGRRALIDSLKGVAEVCDDEAARVVIEQAVKANEEGLRLLREKRFVEAEKHFKDALTLVPDFLDARFNLGLSYFRRNDPALFDAAALEFLAVLKVLPQWPDPRAALGRVLRAQGRIDFAERAFDQALREAPDDAPVRADLAQLWNEAGRADDALTLIRQGYEFNPEHPDLVRTEIEILGRSGRFDELRKMAERLMAKPDAHPAGLIEAAAYAHLTLRDPEFTLKIVEATRKVGGGGARLDEIHGLALAEAGRYAEALPWVLAALKERTDPHLESTAASLLLRMDRVPEALELAKRAFERGGQKNPELGLVWARSLDVSGEFAAALAAYEAFLAAVPRLSRDNPALLEVRDVRARVENLKSDKPATLKEFRHAVENR